MKKDDKKRKTTRAGRSSSSKAGKQTKKAATDKTSKPAAAPKAPKKTTVPKKPATVQKSGKPSRTVKPAATSKTSKAPKKPKLTPIKHSDEYENGTGGDKNHIIVVGKKQQKPRASRRELKRVRTGGYTVFDGKRAGKTFETAEEAANYAVDVLIRTGEAVPVERTDRQVTHTFRPEEQPKKK